MPFKLKGIDDSDIVHVEASEPVDSQALHREHPLRDLVGEDWPSRKIMIDMGGVEHIDSMAVGWLITCRNRTRDGGGKLVLHSIQPRVGRVFDVLKLGSLFAVAADERTARGQFATDQERRDDNA